MSRQATEFDVVLLQPNITWVYDPFEHLGLAYLAAALRRDGFRVKIVDAVLLQLDMAGLYRELDRYRIGVLGVTLVSHGYLVTERFLRYYRERHPEARTAAGGHFATFAAEKIMAHTDVYDAIFLGEAETAFVQYCRAILRGETTDIAGVVLRRNAAVTLSGSPHKLRPHDMDELPFPARDNLRLAMSRGAIPSVTASRGCYARCAFCTVHNFYSVGSGPRWRPRSIENTLEELRVLHHDFDVQTFMFIDDNFIGPGKKGRERALAFADAYRSSGLPMTFAIDCRAVDLDEAVIRELKGAGLVNVMVGIESVSARDLVPYRKDLDPEANWEAVRVLKKYEIGHTLAMIMFNPETDEKSILDNVDFLERSEYYPRNPVMRLNLYEGTDLCKTFAEHVHGPFWDYHFAFAREATRVIYEETIRFCKQTLPLERELSRRSGDRGQTSRMAVNRIRLQFLGDVTRRLGQEPLEAIHARWMAELERLRRELNAEAPIHASESVFGRERLYMTGSPLDAEPSGRCEDTRLEFTEREFLSQTPAGAGQPS